MKVVLRVALVGLAIVVIAGVAAVALTRPGLLDDYRRTLARLAPRTAATPNRARDVASQVAPLVSQVPR